MFITFQPDMESDFVTVNTDHIVSIDFKISDGGPAWPVVVTLINDRKITAYASDEFSTGSPSDSNEDAYPDSLDAYGALEALLGAVSFVGSQEGGHDLRERFTTKPLNLAALRDGAGAGEDAERLGRAVQVRRAELGLKRPELAKRAEMSYPYVSEIENGMKMPSIKALGQLAQALELSLTELMGRAESVELFGSPT